MRCVLHQEVLEAIVPNSDYTESSLHFAFPNWLRLIFGPWETDMHIHPWAFVF